MSNETINVRSAVAKAFESALHFFDGGNELTNLRLEEVDLDESDGVWLITLGYDVATTPVTGGTNTIFTQPRPMTQREVQNFSDQYVQRRVHRDENS